MKIDPKILLDQCDTLMLDMDGTVLDLAFDTYMWLELVPARYAEARSLPPDEAKASLDEHYRAMLGRLEWYCLDHWSDFLGLDIAAMHREERRRIDYLPGAEEFLARIRERDTRLLLVTNSHAETLAIKDEATGIRRHFDAVYSSHRFGAPKETREFWEALYAAESFDPERTLFIDDTARVLASAADYGLTKLLEISHPDSTRPPSQSAMYTSIEGLRTLTP